MAYWHSSGTAKLPDSRMTNSLMPTKLRFKPPDFTRFSLFKVGEASQNSLPNRRLSAARSSLQPQSQMTETLGMVLGETLPTPKYSTLKVTNRDLEGEFSNEILKVKVNTQPQLAKHLRLTREHRKTISGDFIAKFVEGKHLVNKMLYATEMLRKTESARNLLASNVRRQRQTFIASSRSRRSICQTSKTETGSGTYSLAKLHNTESGEANYGDTPRPRAKGLQKTLKRCLISCKELDLGRIPSIPSSLVSREDLGRVISYSKRPVFRFKGGPVDRQGK